MGREFGFGMRDMAGDAPIAYLARTLWLLAPKVSASPNVIVRLAFDPFCA